MSATKQCDKTTTTSRNGSHDRPHPPGDLCVPRHRDTPPVVSTTTTITTTTTTVAENLGETTRVKMPTHPTGMRQTPLMMNGANNDETIVLDHRNTQGHRRRRRRRRRESPRLMMKQDGNRRQGIPQTAHRVQDESLLPSGPMKEGSFEISTKGVVVSRGPDTTGSTETILCKMDIR